MQALEALWMHGMMLHLILANNVTAPNNWIKFGCIYACILFFFIKKFQELETLWMQGLMLHLILVTICLHQILAYSLATYLPASISWFLYDNFLHWQHFGCRQWCYNQYLQTVWLHPILVLKMQQYLFWNKQQSKFCHKIGCRYFNLDGIKIWRMWCFCYPGSEY